MNNLIIFFADYAIFGLFAVLPYLWFSRHKNLALKAAAAALLTWLIGAFIKDFFYFPRPWPMRLMDGSFPSNHTAAAFALSLSVFFHRRSLGLFLLALSLIIGLGRVAEGVHYPIDILGGALLGLCVAWIIDKYHSR